MDDQLGTRAATAALAEHLEVVERSRQVVLDGVAALTAAVVRTVEDGGTVLVGGNGGSAADAGHFVAELVGRYQDDRVAVRAVCLGASAPTLTAVANDYGYERGLAREVEALARPGDLFVAISTSGSSPNVLAAADAATAAGCTVVGLTGADGTELARRCGTTVAVASSSTPRVQEVHALVLHAVAQAVEEHLVAGGPAAT